MTTVSLSGSMDASVDDQKIELYSKNPYTLEYTVTSNGSAYVITGLAIDFYLATDNDSGMFIHKTVGSGITITNGAGGIFQVSIAAADLQGMQGNFFHEARVTPGGGSATTIATGRLVLHLSLGDTPAVPAPTLSGSRITLAQMARGLNGWVLMGAGLGSDPYYSSAPDGPLKTYYLHDYATLQDAVDAAAGACLVIDEDITGHAVLTNAVHQHTLIRGIGRGAVTITGDSADPVLAVRAFNCSVRDLTIDGAANAAAGLAVGDVPGAYVNVGYECRVDDIEIKNAVNGIQFDDLTYYMQFNNVRAVVGLTGHAVEFNDTTGAAGDNGQTLFTGCRLASSLSAVHRTAVSGTRHRIVFEECGFWAGINADFIVDLLGCHNTHLFGCDIEGDGSGTPSSGFLIRWGGFGQSMIGGSVAMGGGMTASAQAWDGSFSGGGLLIANVTYDNIPNNKFAFGSDCDATLLSLIQNGGLGTLYDSGIGGNVKILSGAAIGLRTRYVESAVGSPPTLSVNGEAVIWRDTTNNKSYLMIRANGATVKVECA